MLTTNCVIEEPEVSTQLKPKPAHNTTLYQHHKQVHPTSMTYFPKTILLLPPMSVSTMRTLSAQLLYTFLVFPILFTKPSK
jgi:hypothetical protein